MKRFLTAIMLSSLLLGTSAASADTTTRVSGNTVDTGAGGSSTGWWFNRDPANQTPYEFNDDQASIGSGSLHVPPIGPNPSDKFIGELYLFEPMTSFSVDYLTTSPASDFYLNVYANTPAVSPTNFYQCRFDYVAAGATDGTWRTLTTDAMPTRVVKRAGYTGACDLADMVVRAVSINVGQSTATDTGSSGHLDNVRVVTGDGLHVYDFDPAPLTKDDCKDGGWAQHGFKNQGTCVSAVQRAAE